SNNLIYKIFPIKSMKEFEAYDVKARKKVKMLDPKIVQLKNGRWAVKGKSSETGMIVFRILGKAEADKLKN
ncbi:MAG: hypothetical protein ACKOCQ_02780, partial [Candidatus Nitrosotenuis sp.]